MPLGSLPCFRGIQIFGAMAAAAAAAADAAPGGPYMVVDKACRAGVACDRCRCVARSVMA